MEMMLQYVTTHKLPLAVHIGVVGGLACCAGAAVL